MAQESKTLINPNLYVLCLEAQELILDGWRFKEGFPEMYGWQYHAILEKDEIPVIPQPQPERSTEAPKPVGRPKVSK